MLDACDGASSFSITFGDRVKIVVRLNEERVAASITRLRVLWKRHGEICKECVCLLRDRQI